MGHKAKFNSSNRKISAAERHAAEVEAGGIPLSGSGLNTLCNRAKKQEFLKNFSAATVEYRRAAKFARLLFGDEHSITGSVLGCLADTLEKTGEEEEAKLTWEKSLYIYNKNRAAALRQKSGKKKKKPGKEALPKLKLQSNRNKNRSKARINYFTIHDVYHLEPVDLNISLNRRVQLSDLTPRSKSVCIAARMDPSSLQKRDLHSFYDRGKTYLAQIEQFNKYKERRESILKELSEDREVLLLEEASISRFEALEASIERKKEEEFRKHRRAKNDLRVPKLTSESVPFKGVLFNETYKGAYEAALQLAVDRELCCPACKTVHNFKSRNCVTCGKRVNWEKLIKISDNQLRTELKPLAKVGTIDPLPKISSYPLVRLAEEKGVKPMTSPFLEELKAFRLEKLQSRGKKKSYLKSA